MSRQYACRYYGCCGCDLIVELAILLLQSIPVIISSIIRATTIRKKNKLIFSHPITIRAVLPFFLLFYGNNGIIIIIIISSFINKVLNECSSERVVRADFLQERKSPSLYDAFAVKRQ